MTDLSGKVVLITGAAGTIGRACLQTFIARGARIVLTDRVASPHDVARPDVHFLAADVTDRDAVAAVARAAVERFGRLDAAVLAAGVEGVVSPVEDIGEGDIDQVLAVNVKGCLFAVQACLRQMKTQGGGSIVALSSISGVVGTASLAAYTISKHAVIGLVRATALESGRYGVRINAVCPGPVESEMMQRLDEAFLAQDPGRAAGPSNAARSLPLQRYVSPVEVAEMAAFLCGDRSSACHGGTYMVDGGFTAK